MPGNPQNPREETATWNSGAVGRTHFHGFVNYTISGSIGGHVNVLNWSILLWGEPVAQDACHKLYRSQKNAPNVLEDAKFWPNLPVRQNQGSWEIVFRAFQIPTSGFRPCERPSENQRIQKQRRWVDFIEVCKWALYLEVTEKHQKRSCLNNDCEGSTGRTVNQQSRAQALPTGPQQFYNINNTGRRRQHLFLNTPKSRLYLVWVHLWRRASNLRWYVLEWNER